MSKNKIIIIVIIIVSILILIFGLIIWKRRDRKNNKDTVFYTMNPIKNGDRYYNGVFAYFKNSTGAHEGYFTSNNNFEYIGYPDCKNYNYMYPKKYDRNYSYPDKEEPLTMIPRNEYTTPIQSPADLARVDNISDWNFKYPNDPIYVNYGKSDSKNCDIVMFNSPP